MNGIVVSLLRVLAERYRLGTLLTTVYWRGWKDWSDDRPAPAVDPSGHSAIAGSAWILPAQIW
jgi:hypothetical protein